MTVVVIVVWDRRNSIVLGDHRCGYLGLRRAHGCVEVVGWQYLPKSGPRRNAARQSAYDVASTFVRWADDKGICLAATPATEWHAALYREMDFRSPQGKGPCVTSLSKVRALCRGTPAASIRLPREGMSADQIAALGATS